MMMMRIVRSWLVGVGSNHTSRLLSRTPSFRFGRALTDAFDEAEDDSNDDDNEDDGGHCDDYGFGSSW